MKPVLHLLNNGGWEPALPTPNNLYLETVTWGVISSFRQGSLRNTLESALFKLREIHRESDSQLIAGKCLLVSHTAWKDYKKLVNKWKSLSYRIRKLYPEIDYLWLQDPDQVTSILIDLKLQKALNVNLTEGGEG